MRITIAAKSVRRWEIRQEAQPTNGNRDSRGYSQVIEREGINRANETPGAGLMKYCTLPVEPSLLELAWVGKVPITIGDASADRAAMFPELGDAGAPKLVE